MTDPFTLLPEDSHSEDAIRQLMALREVGETAAATLHERARDVLDIAQAVFKSHAEAQAILKEEGVWCRAFSGTLFDPRCYLYLNEVTFQPETFRLEIWERGCKGDPDSVSHYVHLPLDCLWLSHAALTALFTADLTQRCSDWRAAKAREVQQTEETERAQLAALQAKYPSTT